MCKKSDTYVNPVIKYLMFSFNFFFWLIGCFAIALGTYAYLEKNRFAQKSVESIYDLMFDVAILFIVVGCIIFVIAFFGCIGALRENVILLKIFAVLLGIIFLLEAVGAILMFVFSSQAKESVTNTLKEQAIVRYRDDLDLQNLIDWFQKSFECCGVGNNGPKDWSLNPYFNCSDTNPGAERCGVPYSCCIQDEKTTVINTMCGFGAQKLTTSEQSKKIYTTGCVPAVLNFAEANIYVIAGVAIAVAVLQLVGILLACQLKGQVEDQLSRWNFAAYR